MAVRRLVAEAERRNQRRLLVVTGDREAGIGAAYDAIEAAEFDPEGVTFVTSETGFRYDRRSPSRAGELLGTTREAIVLDCHGQWSPTAIGRVTGAVDGGGLLILLVPPLATWPERRDQFDERLVVPPYRREDVTGHLRERLVETIETHPGVAVVSVAEDEAPTIRRDGLVDDPGPLASIERTIDRKRGSIARLDEDDESEGRSDENKGEEEKEPARGADRRLFPVAIYEACATADQRRAIRAFERLADPETAVVVESDRGRGKSTAAGLAAGAFAAAGEDVLVTAPEESNARTLLETARTTRDRLASREEFDRPSTDDAATSPGSIRYERPLAAVDRLQEADVVFVDEAAAIPVRILETFLSGPSIGFCTTVRGYEGTGRGFEVRFRDRLAESDYGTIDVHLREPIRYAPDDPLETWVFRALLLDASPPPASLVADLDPATVSYREYDGAELAADEHRLRSIFGLLVEAHYRTNPNDLARLLDAPNLSVHALVGGDGDGSAGRDGDGPADRDSDGPADRDGHVVAVALVASEGGLDRETCEAIYRGDRVRGNVIPELLTTQLREETAGMLRGDRVVRIAVHRAARRSGFGTRLLEALRDRSDADYLGTIFGATPGLVRFWRRAGFRSIHLSSTRNDTSGEYSVLMADPQSPDAESLVDRQQQWFADRLPGVLSDPLRDADPDVVRAVLDSIDCRIHPSLPDREWRFVAATAYGPGMYDVAPEGFRRLAIAALLDPEIEFDATTERLLVLKVLQGLDWAIVADELELDAPGHVMRRLAEAYRPIVDRFGADAALAERSEYE